MSWSHTIASMNKERKKERFWKFAVLVAVLALLLKAADSKNLYDEDKSELKNQNILKSRKLSSTVTDGYSSIVTGSIKTSFDAYNQVLFKVQARDELGNFIIVGGDNFVIEIKNECTLDANDNCVTNSGAATVINPEIKTSMIDNGDGTYSYSFTSIKSGKLTVLIYLDSSLNGVYAEFWNNINLSGNVDKTIRYPVINYYWYPLVTTTQCDLTSGRLTTYLTVPKNDTYTIYYKHDNGGRLYFQNVLEIINWIDSVTEESFTISLNTETKYKVVSEFYNVGGPAQSYLSWSYPGQAKEIIPSNYLTYKGLTSSSPLQVTVNPSCGNGVRSLNEQCDDGNTKNDDGCSSNCIVEEYCTCTGGSMTSLDICSCSKPSSKANMKLYTYLFLGLIALGCLSNLLSSSLMQGCIQCIFNFINQVQLILLLPMLCSVMPEVVVDFISSLNICLLNFGIVFESQPEMNSFFSLNYNQTNSYLNSIKLKSGSALVNISGVIYTLLMFVILHFLLCFLIYGVKCNNRDICFHKALNSIFKMLTFGLYIQQIINSLLMMLISSSSEFGRHDLSSK